MEIYLVGGAVRDQLLGLAVKDRDYVVVGATPADMEALGYKPVGADFPVFLHPETKEEYALARTERKSGHGYKGFTVYTSPDVTLEQDLMRRDLTINAMAMAADGSVIDPFGGQEDLQNGLLRHVSPAFGEDPLRVLRVARFAARFARWGFRVSHGTYALMRRMATQGELDHLVPERIWSEIQRALGESRPSEFFRVLRRCGALEKILPEIDALYGVPQAAAHHPEVDTGVHAMLVLDQASQLSDDTRVRFAALMHDLGKGQTPESEWPDHHGHEAPSAQLLRELCQRLRIPNEYRDLGVITARYHGHCHRAMTLAPEAFLEVFEAMDAFRKPERLDQFLLACEADARGRQGHAQQDYPQAQRFRRAWQAAQSVDAAAVAQAAVAAGASSGQIGERLRQARLQAITAQLTASG